MGEITMELMENVLTAGEAPKLKLTAGIRKYQNIILLAGLSVLIARFNCLVGLSPLILPFVLACQPIYLSLQEPLPDFY